MHLWGKEPNGKQKSPNMVSTSNSNNDGKSKCQCVWQSTGLLKHLQFCGFCCSLFTDKRQLEADELVYVAYKSCGNRHQTFPVHSDMLPSTNSSNRNRIHRFQLESFISYFILYYLLFLLFIYQVDLKNLKVCFVVIRCSAMRQYQFD